MFHSVIITARDKVGAYAVEVDPQYGMAFLDGKVYFTDTNGKDYDIPIEEINGINFIDDETEVYRLVR